MANKSSSFQIPGISRLQRNHGLEHATLHVLSARHPHLSLAGHSDLGGFWIVGDVDTEELRSAVDEALQRLRSGERHLAVHPNCGTNFVATGALAGLSAWSAMLGAEDRQEKVERLPVVIGMATLALIAGQPLGALIQSRITTSGDPGNLEVVDVRPGQRGRMVTHRVETRG